MLPGKRGSEGVPAIGFVLIGLLFAMISVTGIANKALDDIKGHTLEKNYIARDLALVLDAVYASPGDLTYTYSLRGYKYVIEISGSRVFMRKPDDSEQNSAVYGFFDGGLPEGDKLAVTFSPVDGNPSPMLLVITKKDGVVSVSGQNVA